MKRPARWRARLFVISFLLVPLPLWGQTCTLSPGSNSNLNEGPTDYAWNLRPAGTLPAVMIFVDFPDAIQAESTTSLYNLLVPNAAAWFNEAAYGRVSLEVAAVHRWYRMPRASTDYGFARGLTFAAHRQYVTDALQAADPDVDYRTYKIVYIVASRNSAVSFSPTFVARPGSGVVVDGVEVRHAVTFGGDIHTQRANYASYILVHETNHLFGLPDLYDFQGAAFSDAHRHAGGWDPMGWLAPGAHVVAWHKWKLGWLDAAQLNCLSSGEVVETLSALDVPGGRKAVVFLVSNSSAFVIEARRTVGFDAGLCDRGVLIYSVDATVPTGAGPVRIRRAQTGTDSSEIARCGPLYNATFDLRAGKPANFTDTASGISVEVTGGSDSAYTVRARRGSTAPAPVINTEGIVSGASFATATAVAPGSIAALFGSALAAGTAAAEAVPLPAVLAGTTVRVDNIAAPLFFASPSQINFQVPWEMAGRTQASVTVTTAAGTSNAAVMRLSDIAPGLFSTQQTGAGQGAVLIAGTSIVAAPVGSVPGSRPVRRGEFISIFGTGLGPVSNRPATGVAAPANSLATAMTPAVTIGGAGATVNFSGLAPGFVGLYQVNALVPENTPSGGAIPVLVQVQGRPSQTVTIAIE